MKKSMIITILATIFMIGCQQETEDSNDTITIDGVEYTEEFVDLVTDPETSDSFCYQGDIFYRTGEVIVVDGNEAPIVRHYVCEQADCVELRCSYNGTPVDNQVHCEENIEIQTVNYDCEIIEQ